MAIDTNRLAETIVATKRLLRHHLPAYVEVFAEVEAHIRSEVADIQARSKRGEFVIPELDYAAVIGGRVSPARTQEIRRRGVVVIRQVFAREQAEAWNQELGEYVTSNGYYEAEADPTLDQYFSTLASARPQIFGIYWSRPQVMARQAESLAATRAFLNGLWISGRDDAVYFDPRRECTYADRIRRREPGDTTLGLSPHMDAGSVQRWP